MTSNLFLKTKRLNESAAVVKRQICYDDMLDVRDMQKLQSYKLEKSIYDSNIYIITSIYYNSQLKLYITHFIQSTCSEDSLKYFMIQLNTWNMIDNSEIFWQKMTAFWNERNLTKKWKDKFIKIVNSIISDMCTEFQFSVSFDNETVSISTADSNEFEFENTSDTDLMKYETEKYKNDTLEMNRNWFKKQKINIIITRNLLEKSSEQ